MDKKDIAKKLQNLLELDREIVGVRLIWDEEDYNACPAQQILYKLPYCTMVKSASTGARIKARPDNMGCFGATMAFGMMELPPQFYSGEMYMAFQMYHDVDAAAGVANNIAVLDKCPYGLEISAIDRMDKDPDVVIIPTIPYNVMRIVQGYSCYYGTQTNFKMAGNQAICSEATTTVYKTQDINVTMMCSGTRYISQWSDNELAVGILLGIGALLAGVHELGGQVLADTGENGQYEQTVELLGNGDRPHEQRSRVSHGVAVVFRPDAVLVGLQEGLGLFDHLHGHLAAGLGDLGERAAHGGHDGRHKGIGLEDVLDPQQALQLGLIVLNARKNVLLDVEDHLDGLFIGHLAHDGEHGKEYGQLDQHGQTAGEGIDLLLLVQIRHLLVQLVLVVGVLLVQLIDLGLNILHGFHALAALDVQRHEQETN